MDEQKIDEVIRQLEKRPGMVQQRCFLLVMCAFLPVIGFTLLLLGSEAIVLALSFGVPMALIALSFWIDMRRPRSVIKWDDFLRFFTTETGALSGRTHKFCERITKIYESEKSEYILPFRHAAHLLNTYHKQQAHLKSLDARIGEIDKLGKPLREKMQKLRELHETNEAGERTLRELHENRRQLALLQEQIEISAKNLEDILSTIETERKKRRLHHEVAQLTQRAQAKQIDNYEGIVPDPVNEWEQQITTEIQAYMQLERETDQRLSQL